MRIAMTAAAVMLVTAVVVASETRGVRVPERLSDTGLYVAGQVGVIAPENRPFSPQYPLWTDGATKRRWVYLPDGARIDGSTFTDWDIPAGTKFWKEFQFAGRKVETRLIWRVSTTRWVFASYVWNAEGTDAVLAPAEGVRGVAEVSAGKRHSVPSETDCAACHGTTRPRPLGFNALQLSPDRDPAAIHGEPLQPDMVTLATLVAENRLAGVSGEVLRRAPRIETENPRTRTALGYLVANCGSCHNGRGEIAALGPTLRYEDLLHDADRVAASLVDQRTKWQGAGRVEGTLLVDSRAPDQSALLARLRSRSPSSQMPPLGTVVRDTAAVQALTEWITRDLVGSAPQSHR
jgi:mono/diheme cytochrome c family protein